MLRKDIRGSTMGAIENSNAESGMGSHSYFAAAADSMAKAIYPRTAR